jgi:hypothetical protein
MRTLEHFHKYLYGQDFHLRTDFSTLTWFMSFKNLEGKLHVGSSAYKNTTLLPYIVKAGKSNMPMLSQDGPAKENIRIVTRSSYGQT